MALKLVTAPALEPVTLLEMKDHLRIESGTMADNLTVTHSIEAGDHVIAALYSLAGSSVDLLGSDSLAVLLTGIFGAGGTVDVKLQHRDDPADAWVDVTGGAFAQVTDVTDETVYELAYSGGKRYIRAVATVAVATCDFGLYLIERAPAVYEDTLIAGLITAAREYCEGYQNRAFITQTWELMFDEFPDSPFQIPLPPLQDVVSIKYYDTAEVEYLFATGNYQEDIDSYKGRVSLHYGKTWPTMTLRPMNGVIVQFEAGYGVAPANVPESVRQAIKVLAAHMYENREATDIKEHREIPFAVKALLGMDRIVPI